MMLIPIKRIKNYLVSNKKLYILSLVVCIVGVILGVILVTGEYIDGEIYTIADYELSEIILGERGFFSLFFQNLWPLLLSMLIIFLLFTNRYTCVLSFFYLGYQGLLLGATMVSLIQDSGIAGVLNGLLLVLPLNLVNFFVVVSLIVTVYKRLAIARLQRLKFWQSVKLFIPQLLWILLGAVFVSFVYALVYPLLLRSVIVVSV